MDKTRPYKQRYDHTFREHAVALVTEKGLSVHEAALRIGIPPSTLYRWKMRDAEEKRSSDYAAEEALS